MKAIISVIVLLRVLSGVEVKPFADTPKSRGGQKKYKVIFRVMRPIIRKSVTNAEMVRDWRQYSVVTNVIFHPENPHSDADILDKLNKGNPQFKFDRIRARLEVEIPADRLWTAPASLSQYNIRLAIIEKNIDILNTKRNEMLVSKKFEEIKIAKAVSDPRQGITPSLLHTMYTQNKRLLYVDYDVQSVRDGKQPSLDSNLGGGWWLDKNATFCITSQMDCHLEGTEKSAKAIFKSADVVVMTILEE